MHALLAAVIAIVGVNVVPMDTERVLPGQTVIVRDGIIETIGAMESVDIPQDAQVVYGVGRHLVPGLIDMHVHIRAVDLPRYLENGVTTVRDLAGTDAVVTTKRRVESGELRGPQIFMSTKLLTGPSFHNPPFTENIPQASQAAATIEAQLQRGADSVKVYSGMPRATYDAVIENARTRGLKVSGHVSNDIDVRYAMTKQDCIEHLSGYSLDSGQRAGLVAATRASGVWNCPTMAVHTQHTSIGMAPAARQQFLDSRRALLAALYQSGARLLAGTDAGWLLPAGVAMHDELDELVAAGFTRFDALGAATRAGGEYLQQPIGTIAPGNRADLLLVDGNPLEDLSVLRKPVLVMLNGEWTTSWGERRRSARR